MFKINSCFHCDTEYTRVNIPKQIKTLQVEFELLDAHST